MKNSLAVIFSLFLSSSLQAQEPDEPKHPIDEKLETCLAEDANSTTAGMLRCLEATHADWEQELEKHIALLMDSLSGKSRALFVKDQQAWETYKTGQLEFINQYYLTRDGTMWWVLAADARAEVIRKRVLQLIHYYEMLPSDPD